MRVTARTFRTEDYWLAVEVPEVPGVYTQVESLEQVPAIVADAVATMTGVAPEDVEVVMQVDWDAEDWDPEEETKEILADPKTMEDIRRAQEEIHRGEGAVLTKDEFIAYARCPRRA